MRRTVTSPRHKALVTIIKDEREAKGLRQADVAAKFGQPYMWMQRVESGERRIDVVEFCELANIIGFDARKVIAKLVKLRA